MSYGLINLARQLARRPYGDLHTARDPFFNSAFRELRPSRTSAARGTDSKHVEKSNQAQNNSSNAPARWSNRSRELDPFRAFDPWTASALDELFPLSRFERDLWRGVEPIWNLERSVMPETEIQETDKTFVVTMDIPGVRKEDVKLKLGGQDNRTLYVTAERREVESTDDSNSETPSASDNANAATSANQPQSKAPETSTQDKPQQSSEVQIQDKEAQTRVVRRSTYKFSQTLELPENVDLKGISAKHEHGQLLITIPKMEHIQQVEQQIPIS